MKSFILIAACLLQTAFGAPQLISFKDGKVGVNFLGYHAEAGLGGGQNDGGLLGGLHASAGTPWGQNAAAGLGGNVNGRAAGMLYAGAQATPDVGASAVLGGDTSRGGFSGTDAYANGKVASRTHTITSAGNTRYRQEQQQHQQHEQQHHQPQPQADNNEAVLPPQPIAENSNAIQKIRPPKKFYSSERYDFIKTDNDDDDVDDDYNNGIALYTNKTKNLYDIEQEKPSSSIFIAKPINKTTISTPFHQQATKGVENPKTIETAAAQERAHTHALNTPQTYGQQLLSNDADTIKTVANYETHTNTALNIKNVTSSSPSIVSPSSLFEPATKSYISLSPSNDDDTSNGQVALPPSAIITRERFQLRNRKQRNQHHHYHHLHQRPQHPKRIQRQRQRQRSKTIVKVLEQEQQQQQQQPLLLVQQNHKPEELLFIDREQQQQQVLPNYQQQHHVRRQFIAPQASAQTEYAASSPCEVSKPGCANAHVNRPVRSEVVQSALQIPIGILQSLQSSLGNLGGSKGY